MKPLIRFRIIDLLRSRGSVTFDELVEAFAPSEATASSELKRRRREALAKNIQRARRAAMEHGETIALFRAGGVTSYALATLPRHPCDDQTMAELTLGQGGRMIRPHHDECRETFTATANLAWRALRSVVAFYGPRPEHVSAFGAERYWACVEAERAMRRAFADEMLYAAAYAADEESL